jgi:hypothetical protein
MSQVAWRPTVSGRTGHDRSHGERGRGDRGVPCRTLHPWCFTTTVGLVGALACLGSTVDAGAAREVVGEGEDDEVSGGEKHAGEEEVGDVPGYLTGLSSACEGWEGGATFGVRMASAAPVDVGRAGIRARLGASEWWRGRQERAVGAGNLDGLVARRVRVRVVAKKARACSRRR